MGLASDQRLETASAVPSHGEAGIEMIKTDCEELEAICVILECGHQAWKVKGSPALLSWLLSLCWLHLGHDSVSGLGGS